MPVRREPDHIAVTPRAPDAVQLRCRAAADHHGAVLVGAILRHRHRRPQQGNTDDARRQSRPRCAHRVLHSSCETWKMRHGRERTVGRISPDVYSVFYRPGEVTAQATKFIQLSLGPSACRADIEPSAVIPGRPRRQVYAACVNLPACGEPGIHTHRRWLWIPGSLAALGPRNDDAEVAANQPKHVCLLLHTDCCQNSPAVLTQSGGRPPPANTGNNMPSDIDPQSGFRLPLLEREDLDEAGRKIYDRASTPGRTIAGLQGPAGIQLYSPKAGEHLGELNRYLRFQSGLDPRIREIAILTVAREMDSQFEWVAHEPEALKEGVAPTVIDVIKYRKSTN